MNEDKDLPTDEYRQADTCHLSSIVIYVKHQNSNYLYGEWLTVIKISLTGFFKVQGRPLMFCRGEGNREKYLKALPQGKMSERP